VGKIRVVVVEDSVTVRARLCAVLAADPEVEVAAEAEDGRHAIELCLALRPDVVTLDMMLPVMSGLAATEYIMAHCPTPILIVSSSTNRGDLFRTYDALAAGALDVLEKPQGDETDEGWERRLVAAVKLVSRIKVITHLRGRARQAAGVPSRPSAATVTTTWNRSVAVGASTGGPAAVVDVLRAIPAPFPLPVFLVMHIGLPFGGALAEWLDGQTPHHVRWAVHGEPIPTDGHVIMAPPDRHLVLRDRKLWLTDDAERHSCRPSIDILFESLAREHGAGVSAALLTGMGRDGAAGLLEIRRVGGMTIAQDEATSVVYGMPREAVRLGAAGRILALPDIGPALAAAAEAVEGPP
jgi:two-component system chemotaxis response regulator CheB